MIAGFVQECIEAATDHGLFLMGRNDHRGQRATVGGHAGNWTTAARGAGGPVAGGVRRWVAMVPLRGRSRASILLGLAVSALLVGAILLGARPWADSSPAPSESAAQRGRSAAPSPPAGPATRLPEKASDRNVVPSGFPTAQTTGVPRGTRLQRVTGDVMVRIDGTVLDGLEIRGCVVVRANRVVIRNSVIRCGGGRTTPFPVRVIDGFTGLLIEDTEIDGLGRAKVALLGSNWTARRVDVHHSTDGLRMGSNTTVERSYVHDLSRLAGTHNDAIQTIGGRNITIIGNTLLAYNAVTDDPMNGAIQTGRLHAPLSGVLVAGNYMDGGSYTIRGGAGPRDGHLISDYVFRNNIIGRNCMYGPVNGIEAPVTWEPNNRWVDSGEVIGMDTRANKRRCLQTP